ncbi:hypothetical protein Vadar_005447 [Vaccinium darrowii]|uniref:Uncharacterized protein n=1 Tax=Vaccinium darrowii TaxID=229202 RepID=A0ACB7XWV6_9ERIC|nr:hypothetical protein Vadar_005447 [Vaccinium darrowii]
MPSFSSVFQWWEISCSSGWAFSSNSQGFSSVNYQFGKAIVFSDAAAEAVRYGFTTVERLEGFLVLAIASLGKHVTEFNQTPEAETRFQRMVLKPAF